MPRSSGRQLPGSVTVKAREDRQKVMIRARMRSSAAWHDVCILNLSVHGLGIQSAFPPTRGAYVEIRRGMQVVVARVAWAKGHRAGLRSQDPIFIKGLLSETGEASPPPANPAGGFVERRRIPRPSSQAHESSRIRGRMIEFACVGIVAAALGMAVVGMLSDMLGRPMSAVRTALGPDPAPPSLESAEKL